MASKSGQSLPPPPCLPYSSPPSSHRPTPTRLPLAIRLYLLICITMHCNVKSYLIMMQIWRRTWSTIVHSRGKAIQMQRVQKIVLCYGHLKTHLLTYSEEKPHPCGQREVSYREAESLNKHILHHSGENPHSCTECKKAFWQTGSISTHLLIHTGEKLHPCGQCDKSFIQAETLNKHLLGLLRWRWKWCWARWQRRWRRIYGDG